MEAIAPEVWSLLSTPSPHVSIPDLSAANTCCAVNNNHQRTIARRLIEIELADVAKAKGKPNNPPDVMTAKESAFVREYLIDLNATQAAIRAGYSAKTANVQAVEIMARPRVMAAINAAKLERSTETKIDAAWVLTRLAVEAEADLADLYDDDNNLKPIKQWPKIWRQGLVAGVEVDELWDGYGEDRTQIGVTKKLKLSDRIKRLELIGKHVGVNAFQDQVKIAGVDELADRIARAKAKLGGKR